MVVCWPYFGYSFCYDAKTAYKKSFSPVSVSVNLVSAKFWLRPSLDFGVQPKVDSRRVWAVTEMAHYIAAQKRLKRDIV